ncbi:MAG: radical SAM protein [candidate division Zixibacteria bacterium]|nr:radical SAM protein [candidate division Zixibacteria bacterium]
MTERLGNKMYVYGPVPSRRLGRSLGVSPIPSKTCSYSCVYCQLGRTDRLRVDRKRYFRPVDILDEIHDNLIESTPEFITFAGDGEPTLNIDLGRMIRHCKESFDVPVAVITNGSLLTDDIVRSDLMAADLVMPSLDAGCERTFKKINRPHRDINYGHMLAGLAQFRHEFSGKIWMEVMLVQGLNDSDEELKMIRSHLDMIKPDRIYVGTPTRPPTEKWVEPVGPEAVIRAKSVLQSRFTLDSFETSEFGLRSFHDAREAITEIGGRHPLRREQAEKIVKFFGKDDTIKDMLTAHLLREVSFNSRSYLLPQKERSIDGG